MRRQRNNTEQRSNGATLITPFLRCSVLIRSLRPLRCLAVLTLVFALAAGTGRPTAQQPQQPQQPDAPRFESAVGVTIVSVDVVVRDAAGNVVRGLTAKDFVVSEDGKPQTIETFSFQEIAAVAPGTPDIQLLDGLEDKVLAEAARAASATPAATAAPVPAADAASLLNRRMLTIVFDVSSMQPDDVQRAVEDAREWVGEKMTTADLVAIITIGSRLTVLTDFTSSSEDALAALQALAYNEGTEINPEAIVTAATEADAASADDASTTTEADAFQEFNNDVRLRALKTLCQELTPIQQKKALMYFSAGMSRGGDDNQIELRSATSTCNRGNVTIYAVDTRGLQAVAAGGSAASRGNGRSLLTGGGMRGFQQLNQSQETLTTLAADTGGRAFTATNDFGDAFARVQSDLSAYYLLGYQSTNPARDGRFRRIQVRLNRPDVKGAPPRGAPGLLRGAQLRQHQCPRSRSAARRSTVGRRVVNGRADGPWHRILPPAGRPTLATIAAATASTCRSRWRCRDLPCRWPTVPLEEGPPRYSWTSRARCATNRGASSASCAKRSECPQAAPRHLPAGRSSISPA